MSVEVNYIIVLLMAVIAMIVGALWYSPLMFGNLWMKIMGADKYSKEEIAKMQKEMAPYYALQFGMSLLTMWVLYVITKWTGAGQGSVWLAFFMWLGFVVPTQVSGVIWGSTPRKHWCNQIMIMMGAQLVIMLIAGYLFSMY